MSDSSQLMRDPARRLKFRTPTRAFTISVPRSTNYPAYDPRPRRSNSDPPRHIPKFKNAQAKNCIHQAEDRPEVHPEVIVLPPQETTHMPLAETPYSTKTLVTKPTKIQDEINPMISNDNWKSVGSGSLAPDKPEPKHSEIPTKLAYNHNAVGSVRERARKWETGLLASNPPIPKFENSIKSPISLVNRRNEFTKSANSLSNSSRRADMWINMSPIASGARKQEERANGSSIPKLPSLKVITTSGGACKEIMSPGQIPEQVFGV